MPDVVTDPGKTAGIPEAPADAPASTEPPPQPEESSSNEENK